MGHRIKYINKVHSHMKPQFQIHVPICIGMSQTGKN